MNFVYGIFKTIAMSATNYKTSPLIYRIKSLGRIHNHDRLVWDLSLWEREVCQLAIGLTLSLLSVTI